jgi:hypothetical protein
MILQSHLRQNLKARKVFSIIVSKLVVFIYFVSRVTQFRCFVC